MSTPRGLGRGLGALLSTSVPSPGGQPLVRYLELPLDAVQPNPRQPRENFDEESLAELAASIREVGVLQPVIVRELAPGAFQLVTGERRWRASRLAGLDSVPALIRHTADDALLRDALLENLHRDQLNPLEEAAAYRQLLNELGATHEELAQRLGRSRAQVTNTLRLLGLPPGVQRRVAAGVLSAGHARALLGVPDPATAERLAARIVAEGLSVRATEELVALGETAPAAPGRSRGPRPAPPAELAQLGERLAERLDTRVRVEPGRRRSRLVVEFASATDLRRIADIILAGEPGG